MSPEFNNSVSSYWSDATSTKSRGAAMRNAKPDATAIALTSSPT
jgi:hypothetical protein